jgi:hypothetical protein
MVTDSSHSKCGRRINALHEVAPSLVSKARKNRANVSSPAPILTARIGNMPEHERAVIVVALTILRIHLRRPDAYATVRMRRRCSQSFAMRNMRLKAMK